MATHGTAHGEIQSDGIHQIVPTAATGYTYVVRTVTVVNGDAIPHRVSLALHNPATGHTEILSSRNMDPGDQWLLTRDMSFVSDENSVLCLVLDARCGTRPIEWSVGYEQSTADANSGYGGSYLGEYGGGFDSGVDSGGSGSGSGSGGSGSGSGGGTPGDDLSGTLGIPGLLAAWLADDLVASTADGDAITAWNDHTGGYNTTGTGTIVHASTNLGGQPAVSFDGTNKFITNSNTNFNTKPEITYVLVYYAPGGDMGGRGLFGSSGLASDARSGIFVSSSGSSGAMRMHHYDDYRTLPNANTNASGSHYLLYYRDVDATGDNVIRCYLDGVELTVDPIVNGGTAPVDNTFRIGHMFDDSVGILNHIGEIAFLAVYDHDLTSAEQSTVYSELSAKYGI